MSTPLLRCRDVRPYLSAYVDGELDEGLQESVRAHLLSCAACNRQVEGYRAVNALVGSLPPSGPSPEVLDRVLAATSRQNRERAVRQSLRRPERPIVHRLLPAFLIADTNLAAPTPVVRNAVTMRRRSWIMVTALPTLAALLLVTLTFLSFHAEERYRGETSVTPVPTVSNVPVVDKTDNAVTNMASQLPFNPQLPTDLPRYAQLQSVNIGSYYKGGPKYLDVVWTLPPPFTTMHLREVGLPLAARATWDYVEAVPIALQTWQIPQFPQWVNMSYNNNNSGRLVEGEDNYPLPGFSVTLDIGARGGNLSEYGDFDLYSQAVYDLRLTSLSIDQIFMPLATVQPPSASMVAYYEMSTAGVSDRKPYHWDVYADGNNDRVRAALYDSSNHLLYTDYRKGNQMTRCSPQGTCEDISSQSALSATDPGALAGQVPNFMGQVPAYLREAALWNMGLVPAPPELAALGIGSEPVYELAYTAGPYQMSVYVNANTKQIVGITSDSQQGDSPGGPDASYPLAILGSTSSCAPVSYPLIAFLPASSPNVLNLNAPAPTSGGKIPQVLTVATCQG